MAALLILLVAIPIIVMVVSASNAAAKRQLEERRQSLMSKYQSDARIVENILRKMVWQGQTEEMLRDSLGLPLDIDRKVLKTKSKQVWKYRLLGRNRYGTRVTLENGYVVGWDIK